MAKMMVSPGMVNSVAVASPALTNIDVSKYSRVAGTAGSHCPAAKSGGSGHCAHCACGTATTAVSGGLEIAKPDYGPLKAPHDAQRLPGVSTIPDPSPPRRSLLS